MDELPNLTEAGDTPEVSRPAWPAIQVYLLATICLALGLLVGYLLRGSQTRQSSGSGDAALQASPHLASSDAGAHATPTLEQMKRVADETADPLLAKLEKQPNNAKLLVQVGNVYKAAHQFKQAAGYYGQSLKIDPANVTIRTEMASCLYYTGNVDGALSELQHSLRDRPKDANSLFNLGMIKW
jgi:cytochrome c-type biogenesis protein CcmH/NrfG